MKAHAFIIACGSLLGAANLALAQGALPPTDPLSDAQSAAGKIVKYAFDLPDPMIVSTSNAPGSPLPAAGRALRTSLEVPGAVWVGLFKPFVDAETTRPVEAHTAPPRPQRRSARHDRRVASQS